MASSSISLTSEVASHVSVGLTSISVVETTSISAVVTPALFNSYVFLDLETTGLILPEDPKSRITELSMWAIERQQFLNCNGTKKIPRVTNRLNMCVYPSKQIHPMASIKSKLDNVNLSHQSQFDEDVGNVVMSFLNRLQKPICMVAHYGFKFDFPVLKSEMANVGKVRLNIWSLCNDIVSCFYYLRNFPKMFSALILFQFSAFVNESLEEFRIRTLWKTFTNEFITIDPK